jgi:LmbE family N-acetylglucosaminyl deacetylase
MKLKSILAFLRTLKTSSYKSEEVLIGKGSILSGLMLLFLFSFANGQDFKPKSSAAIFQDLQQLNFLGNVLYVAAHPDDENTRLISYLTNTIHANTAYLSLTRGDGGQNLIGTEIRELLGVLRTQELLAARNIDGGQQFFTRANDFGFSKDPEETLGIWNKESVLSDMVAVIRTIRPDIIINRFDHRTPGTTHGHHTSSAILSMEAFGLAADPKVYPQQLNRLKTWQPSRVFFNTSWWFYGSQKNFQQASKKGLISLDVGVFYPCLGMSNNEIASLASSQHLCQGFGRLNSRGEEMEYLELLEGSIPQTQDLFDGINTKWTRIPEGKAIEAILNPIQENFDFKNPATHLADLLEAYSLIQQIQDDFWRGQKTGQIKNLIKEIAGLHLAFESNNAYASPGETVGTTLKLLARNTSSVILESVKIKGAKTAKSIGAQPLVLNRSSNISMALEIPQTAPLSNPYWLNEKPSLGLYQVTDQSLIGLPESLPAVIASVLVNIDGTPISFDIPLVYRYAKPDKGELWERFKILPAIDVSLSNEVVLFPSEETKNIAVNVQSFTENQQGSVSLNLPKDWKVEPLTQPFKLLEKGKSLRFDFTVSAPKNATEATATISAKTSTAAYTKSVVPISYDHIPTQRVLVDAQAKFVRLDLEKKGEHIGYIMGAGDKIPESLEAIGYQVELLDPTTLSAKELKKYKAVILGIRALNVVDVLALKKQELLDYVSQGGVLISQYNTANRSGNNEVTIAPFPLTISAERVTDENAAVRLLQPNHPVLSHPNTITEKDFDGWVQERGLYFPNQWHESYTPLLEMNDRGERPKQGSLLVAPVGKGYFVYTGLSFFRELPAGVAGAYRLMANIISLGAASSPSDLSEKN